MTPSTIAYYGVDDARTTREIVHTLRLQAGPQEERFAVVLHRVDSPPLTLVLDGPGTLGPRKLLGATVASPAPLWPGPDQCPVAQPIDEIDAWDLTLPPGASSTLTLTQPANLIRVPTQPLVFRRVWTLSPILTDDTRGTLAQPINAESPTPLLAGLAAAAIDLRVGITGTGPVIGYSNELTAPIKPGLTLTGWRSPVGSSIPVRLWVFDPGKTLPRLLAQVLPGADGRFTYRWLPPQPGTYELYGDWPGQPGLVEATRSPCHGPLIHMLAPPKLSAAAAAQKAASSLRRTFGRSYRHATNKTITCRRQSPTGFACAYRFTVRHRHTGTILVSTDSGTIKSMVHRTTPTPRS
jgi:hypothetical protein